jgi:hypothetical protein
VARVVTIPADGDLLCEGCGYVLNGLPAGANCPECGKPADESSPSLRRPSIWDERSGRSAVAAFLQTTGDVLFRPTHFFRTVTPQPNGPAALRFAQIHWAVAAVLLGTAAMTHYDWFMTLGGSDHVHPFARLLMLLCTCAAAFMLLLTLTHVAAALTAWEARYRGLRLPIAVVLRGLHFHAAHYLPVALVACGTVLGYQLALAREWVSGTSGTSYLYVLCIEVVISAAYLFSTYWTAMRNLIYANR